MHSLDLNYAADGVTSRSYLAYEESSGRQPGELVLREGLAWGSAILRWRRHVSLPRSAMSRSPRGHVGERSEDSSRKRWP